MEISSPRKMFETAATILLTVAAVAVASVYIYGELTDGTASPGPTVAASEMENWREEIAGGIRIGPADARMVVTEFMDFTCPFCAMVIPAVDSLLDFYPAEAALVFQHFPLNGRSQSMPSAVAVECAERQGQFRTMYQLLFAQQQLLGSKDWVVFAEEAGVPDLTGFRECTEMPADSFPRIDAGRDLGLRWSVSGTPTLFVNGRRFGGRSFRELQDVAKDLGLESVKNAIPD